MKLQIRPSAFDDLAKGRWFYDSQQLGIGDYFFDSLFSDIDSLRAKAGDDNSVTATPSLRAYPYRYTKIYETKNN